MSQENAELLKRAVDAYNRRDIEALLNELDPEIEWRPALPGLLVGEPTVYRGYEGIGEMFRDLYEVPNVAELRNGKGIQIRGYLDPKEALEAAGLSE